MAWLPTRDRWLHAVDDLVAAVVRAGATLQLGSEATAGDLIAAGPHAVVLATGAEWESGGASSRRPDRASIPGAGGGNALGLGAALARARDDAASLGRRVVIADETGTYPSLGLAEALALAGAEVHFVSASGSIGGVQLASELELQHLLPRLRKLGVTLTISHDIDRIDDRRVVIHDSLGGAGWELDDVDTVVLALRRAPRVALYAALQGSVPHVHLVGDARSPRTTEAVIYEAEMLARSL
jgi:hypothetical protein